MIRVLLVDDHELIRRGLAELLAGTSDLTCAGSAAGGEEALALAEQTRPDVALMDLSMPGLDGVETTRRLRTVAPATRVVILTSFSERERILAALEAGAVGYLLKDAEPDEILRGVRAAAAGDAPFSAKAATVFLPGGGGSPAAPVEPALSPREREVLGLVAAGLPNKQIGRRLGISEKTVKTHLTNVFAALGVADRTSAALWAQRQGLAG
ncbi:MAG: response regulator transcription factor [Actinomycetota bacterium]|nr:response regulator transcription factor [Actinomycetota bacterium]